MRHLLEEAFNNLMEGYSLKKTGKDIVYDEEGNEGGVERHYDVIHNGTQQKVGELTHSKIHMSGHYHLGGTLHGKDLPDLNGYSGDTPDAKLNRFVNTKTGKAFLSRAKRN